MAGKIFVNYRRGNATAPELNLGASQALNVAQYLQGRFGKNRIFIDIDRLRAGQKFPAVLEGKLADCAVMLAIIGPGWLDAKDAETGARRLDNPEDWVRLEIERALARGVPIIPVLVEALRSRTSATCHRRCSRLSIIIRPRFRTRVLVTKWPGWRRISRR